MSTHERAYAGHSDEWWTPPEVFEALGLTFDLDPCSPPDGPVPWLPAHRHLTVRENGLLTPWAGSVWLNPPYGPQTGRWLARLREHGNGVALVMARTDTAWFHDEAVRGDVLCFIRRRIQFYRGPQDRSNHGASAPSLLIGYGSCADAVASCGLGFVVRPNQADAESPQLTLVEKPA